MRFLQGRSHPGMQPRPVDTAGDGVQALVDERMPEPEPPPGPGRDYQPRGDRGLQVDQQMLRVQAGHAFEQFRLNLPARDRGDEEQRLGIVGKPADLRSSTSRMPLGTSSARTSTAVNGRRRCSLLTSRTSSVV